MFSGENAPEVNSFEGVILNSTAITSSQWGMFTFGYGAFSLDSGGGTVSTLVPLEKQKTSALEVRWTYKKGYSSYKLAGLSMDYRLVSEKTSR